MMPTRVGLFAVLGLLSCNAGAGAEAGLLQVGDHRSPGGGCQIRLSISGMGGAQELWLVRPKSALVSTDVTGAIWRDTNTLVYTGSPTYGRPGLFQLDCRSGQPRTIVSPAVVDKGYPDGADYFELVSVDPVKRQACFYYSAHVDDTDFTVLRVPAHIRCVPLQ